MLTCLVLLVWLVLAYYGGFTFFTQIVGADTWQAIALLLLLTVVTYLGFGD